MTREHLRGDEDSAPPDNGREKQTGETKRPPTEAKPHAHKPRKALKTRRPCASSHGGAGRSPALAGGRDTGACARQVWMLSPQSAALNETEHQRVL